MNHQLDEQELLIADIHEKYPERWVAMIVTQRDDNMQPLKGKVVADDVDRYRLREKIARYDDVCILYAGKAYYNILL